MAKLNVTSCVLNQNMKITGSLHRILLQLYIKKLQNQKITESKKAPNKTKQKKFAVQDLKGKKKLHYLTC